MIGYHASSARKSHAPKKCRHRPYHFITGRNTAPAGFFQHRTKYTIAKFRRTKFVALVVWDTLGRTSICRLLCHSDEGYYRLYYYAQVGINHTHSYTVQKEDDL